jgi:hypothetical protein
MNDSNRNQVAHEIAKGLLSYYPDGYFCLTNFFVRTYKLTIDPQY